MSYIVFTLSFVTISFTIIVFALAIILLALKAIKKPTNKKNVTRTTQVRNNVYNNAHHAKPLPHNSNQTFTRNNEKDIVKDPALSEAERNVLYGK
ncbi:MAG: hypothetical protein PUF50_02715 [Erysipelotrichaceae bacterium]|nr:hypothetical protein [Erysipelotrichaceae bacterium]